MKANKGGGRGGVKILTTIILLLFLFTSYIRVYAQESTPTPESTPDYTNLGDCPDHDPILGQELSFNYKTYCNHCLTHDNGVSIPTLPVGNLLGTPGPEPTPTSSPGMVDYEGVTCWEDYRDIFLEPDVMDTWSATSQKIAYTGSNFRFRNETTDPYYASIKLHDYLVADGSTYAVGRKIEFGTYALLGDEIWVSITRDGGQKYTYQVQPGETLVLDNYETTFPGVIDIEWVVEIYVSTPRGGNNQDGWIYVSPTLVNSFKECNITKEATFYQHMFIDEPEQDVGYCTEYEYADPNNDDGVVDWGGIDIIPGECITIVPSWGYGRDPYGDIGGFDFETPGFSICPQWITIDNIELAGIELPVDIVAVPAIIFVVKMIFNM